MHIFTTRSPDLDELFRLTNEIRAQHGLSTLIRSFPLYQAAQWMAHDMAENNYVGHQDSRGNWIDHRLVPYRYPRRQGSCVVGENVASGQLTPEHVVQSWTESEGHRLNILRENWVSVGFGHCARKWVQVFGSE